MRKNARLEFYAGQYVNLTVPDTNPVRDIDGVRAGGAARAGVPAFA